VLPRHFNAADKKSSGMKVHEIEGPAWRVPRTSRPPKESMQQSAPAAIGMHAEKKEDFAQAAQNGKRE
jgi:hypothetical protein